MNKLDKEFLELKELVNAKALQMGYKVRYNVGPVGEPIRLKVENKELRSLRLVSKHDELVVYKLNGKIYAFKNGIQWDITANFMFLEAMEAMMLEEKIKRKLRKEKPILATLEMIISKLKDDGFDISELTNIFIPCQEKPISITEIRI